VKKWKKIARGMLFEVKRLQTSAAALDRDLEAQGSTWVSGTKAL